MASTLNSTGLQSDNSSPPVFRNSSGTEIGSLCRAWVNFNGVTGSVAIRGTFNVSSITQNGTGDYTANFTNAMPDSNFSVSVAARRITAADTNFNTNLRSTSGAGTNYPLTTTSCRVICGVGGSIQDTDIYCINVFR